MASKRFEDEFTVHVISSASMEIFDQNTLASFRNFFNDEIQLSGDWRVALSENIFPTKIEHITNGVLISYSLSGLEDHQRNSSGANVISLPYNGERLAFMPGTFDTVPLLLAIIKRTVGLPNFSFREIKVPVNLKLSLENTRELRFQAMKFLALLVSRVSLMDEEHILATKWTQLQIN